MISPSHCVTMAQYNMWQNNSLYREANTLSEDVQREDRGAFFGSIQRTLCHVLWGDHLWMSRVDNWERAPVGMSKSAEMITDWEDLKAARIDADKRIADWAGHITGDNLKGDLSWHSSVLNADVTRPVWMLITHFFNHQTHHRGQVHGMLTALGCTPDDTDLPFMPEIT